MTADDCLVNSSTTKEDVIGQKGLTEATTKAAETTKKQVNKKEEPSAPVVSTLNKKVKPPPPPRSSQTRLSTIIKPKSILSPKNSLNTEISPTEALDNLIRNPKLRQSEKKKRVKFNPRIDTSTAAAAATASSATQVDQSNNKSSSSKPLDPNFLHFLPRLNQKQQQEMAKKGNNEIIMNDNVNNKNFSYYEPYI